MSRRALLGEISEITDYLFLSGASELKPNKLRRKRITSIINATTEEPNAYLAGIDYMKVAIEDSAFARIDQYFDIVADRIKMVKDRGGRTLVHCVAGVSRSATLCIVYLVKYEKMTLRRAYSFVKSARPIIRPNIGFWRQMIEYERHLRGTTSVSMVSTTACDQPIPDVYASELKQPFLNGASASKTNVANIPVSMPSVFNRSLLPS
ncbi:hypothetical protein AB6A40_003633 [Gnathostoma spinigerum]|uniref:Dual specificity protein phosphatase 14 n=1 Tax=Gnathostoma spinigerum TaxID=75299 RepID=A0ABD6EHV7_9BILA